MAETVIIYFLFLYDNGARHERVKENQIHFFLSNQICEPRILDLQSNIIREH